MSRALRSACGSNQTPRSYTESEGASLMLELHENERECECHYHPSYQCHLCLLQN